MKASKSVVYPAPLPPGNCHLIKLEFFVYNLSKPAVPALPAFNAALTNSSKRFTSFFTKSFSSLIWGPTLVDTFAPVCLVKKRMNDTKMVDLAIGGHLVFLVLRFLAIALADDKSRSDAMLYISLFLSVDTIVSLMVYFLPKFMFNGDEAETEILPDLFLNTTIILADIIGFSGC